MASTRILLILVVLARSGYAQIVGPCCYGDVCYPNDYSCYTTSTSTYPALGQASASASSNGKNPSGDLFLGSAAGVFYQNQDPNGGFSGQALSQNNASGAGASVGSNVQSSATNTNQTNLVVSGNGNAGSSISATQGAVQNLDQAVSTGNSSAVNLVAQSVAFGNGTIVNGNSNANANANQRSGNKAHSMLVRNVHRNRVVIRPRNQGRSAAVKPGPLRKSRPHVVRAGQKSAKFNKLH